MNVLEMYRSPFGYYGVGSDIKWCNRWTGGKRCRYCQHYAKFEEWSNNWHWYYLVSWRDMLWGGWFHVSFSHFKVNQFYTTKLFNTRYTQAIKDRIKNTPKRYKTTGIKESDLKSLLKKGCKKNRKCKCVSISQRGIWHCPECHALMERMAINKGVHFHDMSLIDRDQLKEDVLILLLSGTL